LRTSYARPDTPATDIAGTFGREYPLPTTRREPVTDARTPWPSASVEKRLADALITRSSPITPRDVAAAFLVPLTAYLLAAHPDSDPAACAAAAADAIRDVCRQPTPYDPTGLPLGAFLRLVAALALRDAVRDEPRLVVAG
jgi:hypothetical protein